MGFSVSAAAATGNLAALAILRSASASSDREALYMQTNRALFAAVANEFGPGDAGGHWIPDMTVRSAALKTNGRAYIAGDHSEISGTGGDDFINTGRYNTVHGGGGNDSMHVNSFGIGYGDEGDDGISGQDSLLYGGAGDDWVRAIGGEGYGEDGNDVIEAISGGRGLGGEGDDIVQASRGSSAFGDAGNDLIVGKGAGNTLTGGAGNDEIDLTEAIHSKVIYEFGDGHDTITVGSESIDFGKIETGQNRLDISGVDSRKTTIEMAGNKASIRFDNDSKNSIVVTFNDDTALTVVFDDGSARSISCVAATYEKAVPQVTAAYREF